MEKLVEELKRLGALKTPRIIEAFLACDRKKFVPEALAASAYEDMALPIGRGQTISQPYTVAFMIELLSPLPGQKILDIGFGSGWTTALLAHIVGPKGRVYGLEIVPELYEFGKNNLKKIPQQNFELYNESGWEGLPAHAPFDRILVSATAQAVPLALKGQLAISGKMVIPLGMPYDCALTVAARIGENEFREKSFPGFAFVPLIE